MSEVEVEEPVKMLSELVLKSDHDYTFAQMHSFVRNHLSAWRSTLNGSASALRPDSHDLPKIERVYLDFLQLQQLIMDLRALDRGIVTGAVDDARERLLDAIRRERMPLVHLTTFSPGADDMIMKCRERLKTSWQLNLAMSVANLIGQALAKNSIQHKRYVN